MTRVVMMNGMKFIVIISKMMSS